MEPLVANCTLDVICDSVMGLHVDAQHNATSEFKWAVNTFIHIFMKKIVYPPFVHRVNVVSNDNIFR